MNLGEKEVAPVVAIREVLAGGCVNLAGGYERSQLLFLVHCCLLGGSDEKRRQIGALSIHLVDYRLE